MSPVPMLQIAMDYITLPPALAMAVKVASEVDIIEIGTPLCKAAGLEAIRSMREIVPDKLILADFKSPDVGGLEAKMAFDAGADMMTVIGGAALATVEQALDMAHKMGKEMLMELTGVRDIIARAKEWREIGVERIVYHRGWDEQTANRQWAEDDRTTMRQLIDMGYKSHGDRRDYHREAALLPAASRVGGHLRPRHPRDGRPARVGARLPVRDAAAVGR